MDSLKIISRIILFYFIKVLFRKFVKLREIKGPSPV